MITKDVVIQNTEGLHARSATYFIQKANTYKSSLKIKNNERCANAKSLLGVLSLGISKGDIVTITADGIDENDALIGLSTLIADGFCN